MSIYKRGSRYWTAFSVDGVLYRKPLGTIKLHEAKKYEREMIQLAQSGSVTPRGGGPKRLFAAITLYIADKTIRCAPRTVELENERLSIVKAHFGDLRLSAITASAIRNFQQRRTKAGIANRTVNMDVGALSRVLKFAHRWKPLADHVKLLPENQPPVGRALTTQESKRLFDTAALNPRWLHVYCAAVIAANTSMRPVELKNLTRGDVNLFEKRMDINRSKLRSSERVLPLNANALRAFGIMLARMDALGFTSPKHFIWFQCQWHRFDPTKPMKKWDTAWRSLRAAAGLPGLRFYDLRHTFITDMLEAGVPDTVVMSITGQLSKRMLDHYSHIRMAAKSQAFETLEVHREEQRERSSTGDKETIQ